jgi:hypothetical protein
VELGERGGGGEREREREREKRERERERVSGTTLAEASSFGHMGQSNEVVEAGMRGTRRRGEG